MILGVCAAFGLTRLIASFLFGVKSWDPVVFVIVPVILAAVALLAVWLPATRASRLDPWQRCASNKRFRPGGILAAGERTPG